MTYTDTTTTQTDLQSWTLAVGRLLIAAIFVLSGFGKIFDIAGTAGYIGSVGLPFPTLGVYVAIIVELLGGLALIAGYKTRIVALVLAGFTLVAAFAFHFDFGDQMQMINFLKNVSITGGLLFVAVFGAGKISLDRK